MEIRMPSNVLRVMTVTLLLILPMPVLSYAGLTAESYCQMGEQIGQRELAYLGKLEILTGQYCGSHRDFQGYCSNPQTYLNKRAAAQKEFSDAKAAVLAAHGVTASESAAFGIVNKGAIAAYLEADPETKQLLEALGAEIARFEETLKIPTYCLLTIAHARQKIQQINEQAALARQYADTPEVFLEQEKAKQKEWDAKIKSVFKIFDTSGKEYLAFMSKNKQAMKQYLEQYTVIKKAIDDLSNQVFASLEQYEQIRQSVVKNTIVPPEQPK